MKFDKKVNNKTKNTRSKEGGLSDKHSAKIQKLNKELKEQKEKYLRLYSDFENFRRRTAKERLDLIMQANEALVISLLPVIDDFERARSSIDKSNDIESVKDGIKLINSNFINILTQKGLKPMEAIGEEFNMDLHEAISKIPAPGKNKKGKVIDEVEKGYFLNDKVIRFAKVVIGD
ncbi:MAG: nucleotide exchange factor GrpE [Cytophagales bacterium]|nr:nucleotide exchange factor GrpE [Cytophagales bacterium]